uniref:Uncharacterized protein n=1 Tax=Amorphochlora amoebiformis TaxID=1561963 RepID=A0A7S0H1K0_9EUKA|mmetsp:Transcript_23281/g.36564  ORF Transcript_23281/g.36564 Transcript_23281/m.36564 type:complete len:132 (+) Transcript_23281:427-822(+)
MTKSVLSSDYYRGAHGILIVYDVTKAESFNSLKKWIQDVRAYAEQNVNLVLIGNKCDLAESREVDYETGENLAKEFGIKFFETSAKDHVNVTEAFDALTRDVIQRKFKGGGENKTTVDIDLKESKSSSCCK